MEWKPEPLAVSSYVILIYLYVTAPGATWRTTSAALGYTLLLLSKRAGADETQKAIAKTWGYVFLAVGLDYDQWRDAVAVLSYALSIAGLYGSEALNSMVQALNVRDATEVLPTIARIALVLYNTIVMS